MRNAGYRADWYLLFLLPLATINQGKPGGPEQWKIRSFPLFTAYPAKWAICGKTHEFPEWKKNFVPNTSTPIGFSAAFPA